MKTSFIVAAAFALFSMGPASAKDNTVIKSSNLKEAIEKTVSFPYATAQTKTEGLVTVSFVVDQDGSIKVLETNASDEQLRTYVVKKLEKLHVKESDSYNGQVQYARFRFKRQ